MRCDLIIPALDESANIDPLFDALAPLRYDAGGPIRSVILADNGSRDDTPDRAAARGAVVVREPCRGYGAACLKALEWIRNQETPPDAVVFLDADCSDDPSKLPALLEPIAKGTAEISIGSRRCLAERGALSLQQRFGNRLACVLMWITTGRRYRDLGPFRAARWTTFEQMEMADRTWGWTVELQMKAALKKIPVVEVDVPYRRRRHGRSKISSSLRGVVAAGTKIIVTIVVLRLRGVRAIKGHG